MTEADLKPPRRTRIGVFLAVALLHLVAALALIRAFAPDFTTSVVRSAVSAFTVTVSVPEPSPTPTPQSTPKPGAPNKSGAAGAAGKKAIPKEATAPKPKIVLPAKRTAPQIASTGTAVTSGASDRGEGTGAGGRGSGPGAGGSGDGSGGGGAATKAVKIAGDINSARDYPREGRDLRINDYVIVALTVGTDGKPTACRVHRPSRDPQSDAITCRLAVQRFRFRPATDARGNPVQSTYGWQQRWFY